MSLTTREQRALDAIRELSKCGFPPSIYEIMDALGTRSVRATQELISALRTKGYLRTWPGKRQRAIVLSPIAADPTLKEAA